MNVLLIKKSQISVGSSRSSSLSVIWKQYRYRNISSILIYGVAKAHFPHLCDFPFLYTSLVVILQEQMNTHENKMSSAG